MSQRSKSESADCPRKGAIISSNQTVTARMYGPEGGHFMGMRDDDCKKRLHSPRSRALACCQA